MILDIMFWGLIIGGVICFILFGFCILGAKAEDEMQDIYDQEILKQKAEVDEKTNK